MSAISSVPFEASDATMVVPSLDRKGCPKQELDFEILAGYLRSVGRRIRVIDAQYCGMDEERLLSEIQISSARLIYWHVPFRSEYGHLNALSKSVRAVLPECFQVAGGNFAAWNDQAVVSSIACLDAVLYGEPELVLDLLLRDLKEGRPWQGEPGITVRRNGIPSRNPPHQLMENLDSLPMAIPDLFHSSRLERGQKVLLGRGCNDDCQYCGLQTFYRDSFKGRTRFWRTRSAKLIVDEIEYYNTQMNATFFEFTSFVLFGYDSNGSAIIQNIAEELLSRRLQITFSFVTHPGPLLRNRAVFSLLKSAGLHHVVLGVDSCLERALRLYNVPFSKNDIVNALEFLHESDIPFNTVFIFYDPYLTLDEIEETLATLRQWGQFYRHMKMPYSYFLDQEILNSALKIDTHIPLLGKLKSDELLQPTDIGDCTLRIAFRDRATERFFKVHQLCVEHIFKRIRHILYDRAVVARVPALEVFSLELLARLLSTLRENPHISVEQAFRELWRWSEALLAGLLGSLEGDSTA